MRLLILSLFFLSSLCAKPIIDLRDSNMDPHHQEMYERPHFIWATKGKHSHVIVLTDQHVKRAAKKRKQGYMKVIAYLLEPRVIHPKVYKYVEKHADAFDLILTFDKQLLDKFPNKSRFIHAVGAGSLNYYGLHPKSKLCSIMTGKDWTEGHRLRLDAYREYASFFDGYKGLDTPRARWKDPWINDFYFSVVVENSRAAHYFSEKISDCFRAGTVPIYWGCPTIGEFFDAEGIITFNTLEELGEILKNLSVEDYMRRLPAIKKNYKLVAKYPDHFLTTLPERPDAMDVIWPHVLSFFH